MKPYAPKYAWLDAAESAVIEGLGKPNFWSWARHERTRIILASLNALPSGVSAFLIEVPLEAYHECYCSALTAAREVIAERKQRKTRGIREQRY